MKFFPITYQKSRLYEYNIDQILNSEYYFVVNS